MKISVVIPALNAEKHLEAALESIWNQSHKDIEILVMDGGSTDGTKAILEKYSSKVHFWRSAPDGGTSHAMNEGFKRSTGDLVTFLCSDDRFRDSEVFADAVRFFEAEPMLDVLCTEIEGYDSEDPNFYYLSKSTIKGMAHRMTVNLPGAFFKRDVLKARQFSYKVEVANDYELFLYLIKTARVNIKLVDRKSVLFSMGGRTNTPATDFWMAKDCLYLRWHYFGFWPAVPLYLRDIAVSALRRAKIRPFRWYRLIRKSILADRQKLIVDHLGGWSAKGRD